MAFLFLFFSYRRQKKILWAEHRGGNSEAAADSADQLVRGRPCVNRKKHACSG